MKYSFILFILILIFLPALLISCGGDICDGGCPCTDKPKEWPYPTTATTWLLKPFKTGDSIKFKIYVRHNRLSNYVFRGNESFFIKDTIYKNVSQMNPYYDLNCNSIMIVKYLTEEIEGPESLSCQLTDKSELDIGLQGTVFNAGSDNFLPNKPNWIDTMRIAGQNFYSVSRIIGKDQQTKLYTDSTYMFYNQQYGLLRFIINDTLIYERNLH